MATAKQIFLDALERDASRRGDFLEVACEGDKQLRVKVEALLAAQASPDSYLDRPAMRSELSATARHDHDTESTAEGPGSRIGNYKLLQEVGEGGFGVVYMAEQQEPVRRTVALKVIKPGMDTREVIARFEAERQALALMNHPNIAKVLDAGATDSGRPYFVMELVKGIPLTRFCDENNFSPQKRLKLFITICHAVQHAHQKGVIHRDLKPSNVMVTLHDGKPVPMVIDFGVSKAISQRLTERTLFTRYGQMVGTPQYMSPEQAEMSGLDVDTRSDVYSLGVMLYELLTGTTPLEVEKLRDAGYAEMLRLIKEAEAPKPSTRLSTLDERLTVICAHRSTDEKQLGELVRRELDWVAMKALDKDRNRRYASASELADDVQRHLDGEQVNACPPTFGYRLSKFAKRYQGQVIVAVSIASLILISSVFAWWQFIAAQTARSEAEAANVQLLAETRRARDNAEVAQENRKEAVDAQTALEQKLYAENIANASRLIEDDKLNEARRVVEQTRSESRNWEWHRLNSLLPTVEKIPVSETTITSFQPAHHGDLCVVSETPNVIKVVDLKQRKTIWSRKTEVPQPAVARFSPGGKYIFIATAPLRRSPPSGVELWSVDGEQLWNTRSEEELFDVPAFSLDDEKFLVCRGSGYPVKGIIEVLDPRTKKRLYYRETKGFPMGQFTADGERLIVTLGGSFNMYDDTTLKCFDLATDEEIWSREHSATAYPIVHSRTGQIVVGASNHDLVVCDPETGATLERIRGNLSGVAGVTYFSPDENYLLSAGMDGQIAIWDWRTKRIVQSFLRKRKFIPNFRSTSRDLGVISDDGKSLAFSPILTSPLDLELHSSDRQVVAFRFDDAARLQSLDRNGYLRTWNLKTGMEEVVAGPFGNLEQAAFSPNGDFLAIGNKKGIELVSLTSNQSAGVFELPCRWTYSIEWSPGGRYVAAACDAGLIVGDAEKNTSQVLEEFGVATEGVRFVDETKLATLSEFGKLTVVDVNTRESTVLRPENSGERARPILWLRQSKQLAIGLETKIEFWDLETRKLVRTVDCEGAMVTQLLASKEESRLVVGDSDGEITIWSLESSFPLLKLRGHERGRAATDYVLGVQSLLFSNDENTLVSGGRDGRIHVWESRPPTSQDQLERRAVADATALVDRLVSNDTDPQALSGKIRQLTDVAEPVRRRALELVITRGEHLVASRNVVEGGSPVARLNLKTDWLQQLQETDSRSDRLRTQLLDGISRKSNFGIFSDKATVNSLSADTALEWSKLINDLARLPIRKSQADSLAKPLATQHPENALILCVAGDLMAAHHDWSQAHEFFASALEQLDPSSAIGQLVATKVAALELRAGETDAFAQRCKTMLRTIDEQTSPRLRWRVARVCLVATDSSEVFSRCAELLTNVDPEDIPVDEVAWLSITKAKLAMRQKDFKTALAASEAALEQIVRGRLVNYARSSANVLRHLAAIETGAGIVADQALNAHHYVVDVQPFLAADTQEVHRDWEQWILHDRIARHRR